MDDPTLAVWIMGIVIVAATGLSFWRISVRVKAARNWPVADATIESAEIERVGRGLNVADLPCFAFSYVVKGQDYSGRFALRATPDRVESLMRQMVEKKMAIHYDPKWPSGWYIPVDTIGGCEVVQKLYPKFDREDPED